MCKIKDISVRIIYFYCLLGNVPMAVWRQGASALSAPSHRHPSTSQTEVHILANLISLTEVSEGSAKHFASLALISQLAG